MIISSFLAKLFAFFSFIFWLSSPIKTKASFGLKISRILAKIPVSELKKSAFERIFCVLPFFTSIMSEQSL